MTFSKYKEMIGEHIEDGSVSFHLLCLVSDTTKLLEKIKYFRNENALILSDIGDVIFRLFSIIKKFEINFDEEPFNLEEFKLNTPGLKNLYVISEDNLLQNYIFEVGLMSNIVTDNMRYEVPLIGIDDIARIKNSIYSYILQILILVSKLDFSPDKILEMNIARLKAKNKDLNVKI